MHPTFELMAARHARGSQPLHRDDDARLAVVIEGGSSRAAFGGGMVAELETRGLLHTFDAVYGTSAGALNGGWLVCERANDNVHGWWVPESMNASIRPRNALRGKPVVDTDVIIYDLYENLTPMGFEEILASDIEYHPIATDVETGESADLEPLIHDKATLQDAMRATTRMPVLGGLPVEIGGRKFLDGGIAENIPIETALAQGATHVLVLRTKAPDLTLQSAPALERRVVTRWMSRHAPGTVAAWAGRDARKLELEQMMADDDRVVQVAPPVNAAKISRVGRSPEVQKAAVDSGRRFMADALDGA